MSSLHVLRSIQPTFALVVCVFETVAALAASVPVIENSEESAAKHNKAERLTLVAEAEIGIEEGDESYVFGRLTDVALDSHDNVFALDGGYKIIRRYRSNGECYGSLGREGEGPGEFFYPTAIAFDELDNLYVASQGKISIFDSVGTFVDDFRHAIPDCHARSLRVATNDGVYVSCLDLFEQKTIHKYGYDGHDLLISFSESYAKGKDVDVRIESTYGGGVIDLSPDGQTIYYSQMTPYEIRLFGPSGELALVVHRDNDFLEPPKVETLPDGSVHFGGFSGSSAIVALNDGRFLNVVRLSKPTEAGDKTIIDVFARDGAMLATIREKRNLNVKCADSKGRLYAVDLDVYPRIVRFRLEGVK